MSELAAIAIRHSGYQPAAIVAGVQFNFSDAREILADDVGVLLGVGTQLVEINLLIEVGVLRRTLIALRIARVVKAGAVGLPGKAAAGSRKVYPGTTSESSLPVAVSPVAVSKMCTEESSEPFSERAAATYLPSSEGT